MIYSQDFENMIDCMIRLSRQTQDGYCEKISCTSTWIKIGSRRNPKDCELLYLDPNDEVVFLCDATPDGTMPTRNLHLGTATWHTQDTIWKLFLFLFLMGDILYMHCLISECAVWVHWISEILGKSGESEVGWGKEDLQLMRIK